MKAILTYKTIIDGKEVEQTRLFDTTKAKKICDVKNGFGNKVQEIYITDKGVIFLYTTTKSGKIEVADQKRIKTWIGENEPDKYIEFFGEVEEA
ncbi:MAG: hypothetical protein HFG52_08875 [Lachnospiraceae bacterium]|nr:hypothetical protein [Lachnospiraceae bacterium]